MRTTWDDASPARKRGCDQGIALRLFVLGDYSFFLREGRLFLAEPQSTQGAQRLLVAEAHEKEFKLTKNRIPEELGYYERVPCGRCYPCVSALK
jgi:hypothetical protein